MRGKKKSKENGKRDRSLKDVAEEQLAQQLDAPLDMKGKTPAELIQELRVHQVELGMQNEELRRAQVKLDAARERYFDLYDLVVPVGHCILSEQGLILEANLTAATLLGVARGALGKRPIFRFILKADQDIYYLHRKQLFETGEPQACELRMVKQNGTIFWVRLAAAAAQNEGGAPVCRVVMIDITERKQAEEEIQRNELRLRRLVDILQHPSETIQDFLDYALDQAIQLTGSKIGYIYHYHEDRKELVLNTWSKGVMAECAIANPPTCYELDKTGIWGEAVRQRRPIIVNDFQAAHPLKKGYPEGHVQLLKFLTVPIFKGDSIVGVVGLANKETDYKETDILQGSLLMGAVWKVTESMREKAKLEAMLQQAQKLESIGTLAGGIAHDFNNILSAIIGYSELALDYAPEGSDLYRDIHEVLNAGNRAKELVKQILTFARYSDVEMNPIRAKYMVKEALKLLRSSIPSTIEIHQYIDSDAIILANTTQIHQMVMNLCTNAAHSMEAHGGILNVHLKKVALDNNFAQLHPGIAPGNYLQLSVQDTGHGMGQDIIEKIFDPYFTTKKIGEGTGLGLSVVKGIVEICKGLITVKSELGKGSIFDVYLPVLNGETQVATGPVETEEAPTGDERILFVDDEPPIAIIGEQMLAKLGYQVTVRTSAFEALELFKTNPSRFELVITDMTMPHMTGDVLAAEIRKIRPDIPMVLCTGYSKMISLERAKEIGINAFLMKPVVKIQLAKTVRKVLDEAKDSKAT